MNPYTAHNDDPIEEVGAPHQFSANYEARKRALIAEVARGGLAAHAVQAGGAAGVNSRAKDSHFKGQNAARNLSWKIAAAVAAVCVALPVGAYAAANHEELYSAMFGDSVRHSTPEQTVTFDKGDGKTYNSVIPSHEYVSADPEMVERVLGGALCDTPQVIDAGSYQLTITSVVRSENQMVVAYTLKDNPEFPTLVWDAHSNATKGARFAEDTRLRWEYRTSAKADLDPAADAALSQGNEEAASELPAEGQEAFGPIQDTAVIGNSVFVDPERSTSDTLYCYDYLVFPDGIPAEADVMLTASWADGAVLDMDAGAVQTKTVTLDTPALVESSALSSENGSQLVFSPLGLVLDVASVVSNNGGDSAYDPYSVRDVIVRYKDGTAYEVWNSNENRENSMYALGVDTNLGIVFNRLVDPAAVESVEVINREGTSTVFA